MPRGLQGWVRLVPTGKEVREIGERTKLGQSLKSGPGKAEFLLLLWIRVGWQQNCCRQAALAAVAAAAF